MNSLSAEYGTTADGLMAARAGQLALIAVPCSDGQGLWIVTAAPGSKPIGQWCRVMASALARGLPMRMALERMSMPVLSICDSAKRLLAWRFCSARPRPGALRSARRAMPRVSSSTAQPAMAVSIWTRNATLPCPMRSGCRMAGTRRMPTGPWLPQAILSSSPTRNGAWPSAACPVEAGCLGGVPWQSAWPRTAGRLNSARSRLHGSGAFRAQLLACRRPSAPRDQPCHHNRRGWFAGPVAASQRPGIHGGLPSPDQSWPTGREEEQVCSRAGRGAGRESAAPRLAFEPVLLSFKGIRHGFCFQILLTRCRVLPNRCCITAASRRAGHRGAARRRRAVRHCKIARSDDPGLRRGRRCGGMGLEGGL